MISGSPSSIYPDVHEPKLKLAMAVGGEYRLGIIERRHWERLATELGLDAGEVVARVDYIATSVPEHMAEVASSPAVQTLESDLPERLLDRVARRAKDCRNRLS